MSEEENTEVKIKKTFDGPDSVTIEEKTTTTTEKKQKEDNPKEAQD